MRIDLNFSRTQLPSDVRIWYDRLWAGLNNPNQVMNLTALANSNDTYNYGRTLGDHITALLHVLRVTGDPAILNEIDRLMELMRAQLKDWSITKYDGTTYEADGYLNWLYNYDLDYRGTDVHVMDEMFTHQNVAAVVYAYYLNRDLDARYHERYVFWINYLKNHFEAKWRKRNNAPSGNFLEKDLAHVYTAWTRYHYYMYKMTGEQQYLTEATRRANVVGSHMIGVNGGSQYVWDHRMTEVNNGSSWGCQPFYYARGTVQYMIDLSLEGFSVFDDVFMTKLAGSVTGLILDDGSRSFAPDICGGVSLGGLNASGYAREDQKRWSDTSGYVEIGAWDATGKIGQVTEQVYKNIEYDVTKPRYILNAAGMVFSATHRQNIK